MFKHIVGNVVLKLVFMIGMAVAASVLLQSTKANVAPTEVTLDVEAGTFLVGHARSMIDRTGSGVNGNGGVIFMIEGPRQVHLVMEEGNFSVVTADEALATYCHHRSKLPQMPYHGFLHTQTIFDWTTIDC